MGLGDREGWAVRAGGKDRHDRVSVPVGHLERKSPDGRTSDRAMIAEPAAHLLALHLARLVDHGEHRLANRLGG